MKKIVFFSDGTGNSSASPHKTNVWRAYKALDTSPDSGQIAFYDNGVGTSPFTLRAIVGLAFGFGMARNVREIYGFLCRTYCPGDEIYGFGFSRGAFTIRVAIALIANQGIVDRRYAKDDRDMDRLIAEAYRGFRRESFTPSVLSLPLGWLRDKLLRLRDRVQKLKPYSPQKNLRYLDAEGETHLIKFLGVWDTVDAYGLPIDELTRGWDKVVWPLSAKDRDLSVRVDRACHALALDEQRESFEPMLWNEQGDGSSGGRVQQVWFPGVHANIGGGYPDDALAIVALNWMLNESEKDDGLKYIPRERERYLEQADGMGKIHNSRSGIGNLYRYAPRNVELLCQDKRPGFANSVKPRLPSSIKRRLRDPKVSENEVRIDRPKIHYTVFNRIAHGGDAYAPINLPEKYAFLQPDGSLIDIDAGESCGEDMPETCEQAGVRRQRQSLVWNKVWARKLLYFATVGMLLWFIFYPSLTDKAGGTELDGIMARIFAPLVGSLGAVVHSVPELIGKVPGLGFAGDWANSYATYPYVFSLGVLVIAATLLGSIRLRGALKHEMRSNWHHVSGLNGPEPGPPGSFRQSLAGFLEGDLYTKKIAKGRRIALESLGVVFFVVLVIAVFSHGSFIIQDGLGVVCEAEPEERRVELGEIFRFDPKDPCFFTGLRLEQDMHYEVELEVVDWMDKGVKADVNGWRDAPWYLYLATPLRRHLFADWYQPIARIDDNLFDRYPLQPIESPEEVGVVMQNYLRMQMKARRGGWLFLYLNDAVLLNPAIVPQIYSNNKGHACVRVRLLQVQNAGIDAMAAQGDRSPMSC